MLPIKTTFDKTYPSVEERIYFMSKYQPHAHEKERLAALDSYKILDSLPEKDYDDLVRLASYICNAPISMVNLIAANRQWSKAVHGTDLKELPRETAFCSQAINSDDEVFIVHDTHKDERFRNNPLVVEDPKLGFYAGVKLETEDGLPLGMFCVLDHEPRDLSEEQKDALKIIGKQVMNLLNLRKNNLSLEQTKEALESRNDELERFAYLAAHDLKSPLGQISGLLSLFKESYADELDEEALEILQVVDQSSESLKSLIDGLLDYARSDEILKSKREWVDVAELKKEITQPFSLGEKVKVEIKTDLERLFVNENAFQRILINLIGNAIKYNDKEQTRVEVSMVRKGGYYQIEVCDNGPGIKKEDREKIFEMFKVLDRTDHEGKQGHGIGLAMVRKLVASMGGDISVRDNNENGACFYLDITTGQ